MFYRQHRLVIDGKYSSDDGLSTIVKMAGSECACEDSGGFGSESSGGTTSRSTRAAKLKIQEFTEEKEDRDPQPLDLIQKSRQPSDRTGAARGLPSGKAKVKS
jgi:hypothetical protein